MKKKFLGLSNKKQVFIFIILYILSLAFALLSSVANVFAFLTCAFLALAIVLTVWYSQSKKSEKLVEKSIDSTTQSLFGDVSIVDIDGTKKTVSRFSVIQDGLCLYSEGGKTFHTHVSCFTNWKPEMRNNFSHWNIITLDDAQKRGLKKCSFCEYNDLSTEEKISRKIANRKYITVKLTGSSSSNVQENIDDVLELEDAAIEFDDEKEKYAVYSDQQYLLGYLGAGIQNKLKQMQMDIEELECFVLSVDEDENEKKSVTVIVITE